MTRRTSASKPEAPSASTNGSASARRRQPTLPPLWVERNWLLDKLPLPGMPRGTYSTMAGLDAQEARALGEIATGKLAWSLTAPMWLRTPVASRPIASATSGDRLVEDSDPDVRWERTVSLRGVPPNRFHWQHPYCFINLPEVWREARALVSWLVSHGKPEVEAHAETILWGDMVHSQSAWSAYGKRVYYLDPATAELFLQTPLPSFSIDDLRPPIPSFVLALPEHRYRFTVAGDPVPQPADSVHVTFTGGDDDEVQDIALLITGRSPRGHHDDDNVLSSIIRVRPGMRLDQIRPSRELPEIGDDVLRLVLGLCLYLSSEHPSVVPVPPPKIEITAKNPGKRRKQEQRAARHSRLGFLWVGPHETEAGDESEVESVTRGTGKRWSLDHALWVQGHWKQQVYGPGRSLRRPVWIKPYRKGPDFAEAMRTRAVRVQPGRLASEETPHSDD